VSLAPVIDSGEESIGYGPILNRRNAARGTVATVIAAVALLIGPRVAAAQCAMCGTALQDGGDPLTRGVLYSTLFLISLPYAICGSFAAYLYWRSRRARAEQAARSGPSLRLIPGGLAAVGKEEGQ
jgi:hypothetical protein